MGCGCGGGASNRKLRNTVKPPQILGVAGQTGSKEVNEAQQTLNDEKRKIEKLRRDALLRALGRP